MPKPKQLNRQRLNDQFEAAHRLGAEHHGMMWLSANEAAVHGAEMIEGVTVDDLHTKALLSVVVLRVLDRLTRLGHIPKPKAKEPDPLCSKCQKDGCKGECRIRVEV